jgi:Domain of unknown function (DUF5069)
MEPLDLSTRAPRSPYDELDGLVLMPRTIDKLRALLPGGSPGGYWINGPIVGISGYLLQRLGISEADLAAAIATAASDDEVATWIRERTDTSQYPLLNATLRRVEPKHAEDPAVFAKIYAETLAQHPELTTVFEIMEADDERMFGVRVR